MVRRILSQAEQFPWRISALTTPPVLEPWRPDLRTAVTQPQSMHMNMPTHLVRSYAITDAPLHRTEQDYRDKLMEDVRQNGIQKPLDIYTTADGERGYLGDGNHRLEAAEQLGITHLPVQIVPGMTFGMDKAPITEESVYNWVQNHYS